MVMQKSPVQHHCAFGILCCLLFYFFLFTPETGEKKCSIHGGEEVTTSISAKHQFATEGCRIGLIGGLIHLSTGVLVVSLYLLCEKTSRATDGTTSRGSQARSFWISWWAPLVKDRKDSCRHTSDQLEHIYPGLLLLRNCW